VKSGDGEGEIELLGRGSVNRHRIVGSLQWNLMTAWTLVCEIQ
jgi:hypothetical protein